MAAPLSIRPSIGRVISSARIFSFTHTHHVSNLPAHTPILKCPFSSTPERSMRRPRRDNNRLRGVSSIYRSGPRFRMNIDRSEVPTPAEYKPDIEVDPNHGLYEFFCAKDKVFLKPDEDSQHGRAWSVEELRHKSWDDLHKLWWVCVKEQNRIATAREEKKRLDLRKGNDETADRLKEVRKTMQAVRHALTERFYLWEDARQLAETDPEVDLGSTRQPYTPSSYFEGGDDEALAATVEREQALEKNDTTGIDKPSPGSIDPSTLPPTATEPQQPSSRS